jgi:hypothetical protein
MEGSYGRLARMRTLRPGGPIEVEFDIIHGDKERSLSVTIAPGEDPWPILEAHLRDTKGLVFGETRKLQVDVPEAGEA